MSGFFDNSLITALMRSSNCPRYLVPATSDAMSSAKIRLLNSVRDTLRFTILIASPSTIADLPTPGSPMSTGLFFLRRLSICDRRSISLSRPTTGSRRSFSASLVMSLPYLFSTGVSAVSRTDVRLAVLLPAPDCSAPLLGGKSSSSSSSSSAKSGPLVGSICRLSIYFSMSSLFKFICCCFF